MPVFISHRTADDAVAREIYSRLTNVHSITCYIDDIDKQAGSANRGDQITSLIVKRVNQCTNLLALVTSNTKGSWWVPFEVGVARQAPRMISSFTNLDSRELPEFLTEWPILRGPGAIDEFAKYYKLQAAVVKRAFVENTAAASLGISSIDTFHRSLKAALGQ